MATSNRSDLNPATDVLQSVLAELEISTEVSLGTLVMNDARAIVRADCESAAAGATVRFDVYLAQESDQILTHTSTILSDESDDDPATAIRDVCHDWALSCLDPLRRALNEEEEADGYFYLYVAPERQVLFNVYCGHYLTQGEDSSQWSRQFPHSLFDWLVAQEQLHYPDQRFNLLRLGMSTDSEGSFQGLSLLNGSPWPEADELMRTLEWPGPAPQRLLNYVVLQRINVSPPESSDLA